VNERRDELSTADIAGAAPPDDARDDADREDEHRAGGPFDRLRRAFGTDDRGADSGADGGAGDRVGDAFGTDDRGADTGADDRGADGGADEGADRPLVDADDRPLAADTDLDRDGERSPADADDRLLPPPGGLTPMTVGVVAADRSHDPDDDRSADAGADPFGADDRGADTGADDRGADGGADEGADAALAPADDAPLPLAGEVAPTPVGAMTDAQPADTGGVPTAGGPLLPATDVETFRARWLEVQTGFVDSPREAVEHADGLTAELMQYLARTFADERSRLERQWDGGDDVATDDLRAAFQRYRSFFERLLAT
jgi:hypothetical protein